MQLVQQRFEFSVGNFVAGRFRRAGNRLCGNLGAELAFAVQLVKQRLELGVGNFVTFAADGFALHLLLGRSLCLDRIERIEQLLELAVSDVLLLGRRLDNRLRRRSGRRFNGFGAPGSARRDSAASSSGVAAVTSARSRTWPNMLLTVSSASSTTSISSASTRRSPLRRTSNTFSAIWQHSTSSFS